jgi:hypothetical protein
VRGQIVINRRSGVAHRSRLCEALDGVPRAALRWEAYDPERPRRKCSRCWNGSDSPRRSAFAGTDVSVTERSEGNPRSGLTGAADPVFAATERAVGHECGGSGGLVTPPMQSDLGLGQ